MLDIPCIQNLSMINETLKEDILKGKSMDILLLLVSGAKTSREISKELNIPAFSVQLYLNRLIEGNLIRIVDVRVYEGKVEKTYQLSSSDVEILNYIQTNSKSQDNNIELSAQHFSTMTRNVIRSIDQFKTKPHKIKAYFIKSDEASMLAFKSELEELFIKYQALEDLEASETYGFISVLAPYKL